GRTRHVRHRRRLRLRRARLPRQRRRQTAAPVGGDRPGDEQEVRGRAERRRRGPGRAPDRGTDGPLGGSHGGLPIFVPSHRPPGPAARWSYSLVTYVTDGIESAMAQANAAAGSTDVQVRGAYTGQRALEAG